MKHDRQDRASGRATHEQNPQAVSAVPVGIPDAAKIGWLERFLRKRREDRMCKAFGGIQRCPWCQQWTQENNSKWRFEQSKNDPNLDTLTCGVCGGRSEWLWAIGFIWVRNLDHPAQAMEARQGGDEGSVHDSAVGNADAPDGGNHEA